jgi:hypothetical protein
MPLEGVALLARVMIACRVFGGVSIDEDFARLLVGGVSDCEFLRDGRQGAYATSTDSWKFISSGCLRSLLGRSETSWVGCGTTIGFIWWSVYNSNGATGFINSEPEASRKGWTVEMSSRVESPFIS